MNENKLLETLVTLSAMQIQILSEIKSIVLKHTNQQSGHDFSLSSVVEHARDQRNGLIRIADK